MILYVTHEKLIICGYKSIFWKRLNDFYSYVELGFRVLDFRHGGEDEKMGWVQVADSDPIFLFGRLAPIMIFCLHQLGFTTITRVLESGNDFVIIKTMSFF